MRTPAARGAAALQASLGLAWLAAACGPAPAPAEAPASAGERPAAPRQDEASLRALESLGYLGAEEERAGRPVGLLRHDRERAWPGLNLYTSGHAAEAVLMDMEAGLLHRWSLDFERAFPNAPPDPEADLRGRHHWRRVYLQPNGDLIAIFEGQGLLRLDRDSELVWKSKLRAHHAAQVLPSGELHVLTRKIHTTEVLGLPRPIAEDFVSVVDAATGKLLRETSVLRALERSAFRPLLEQSPKVEDDILHTNSLELLDGRGAGIQEAFQAGSYLLSSRVLDTIFVLDPAAGDGRGLVTWAQRGSWRGQHEPQLLESGNILLFDNNGTEPHSRILEIPLTPAGQAPAERVVYAGSPERRFYSKFCGAAARLPNGNTLITETGPGRAFEVTPAGELVWEFVNPHEDQGKVASIFELVRLPADAAAGW